MLNRLTAELVPDLVAAFGIGADIAAEMLIVAGDNPERVRSEPAFAKLCGVAPIPASSGMTTRHRLNRGGHRQANSALYRAVIVRLQYHQPTQAYYQRRTAEGRTKAEIIRCLKRLLAREIWSYLRPLRQARQTTRSCCLTAIGASTRRWNPSSPCCRTTSSTVTAGTPDTSCGSRSSAGSNAPITADAANSDSDG